MNLADFKETVAGYANRSASALVRNNQDFILFAMNSSKRFAQRQHNFARLLRKGYVEIASTGTPLYQVVNQPGGTTLGMKNVLRVHGVKYTTVANLWDRAQGVSSIAQIGEELFAFAPDGTASAAQVDLVGHVWLPDYSSAHTSDFFLTDCYDWLLHSSIIHLNFFLKEDERIQISQGFLTMLWQNVLTWDASQDSMGRDVSLD